MKCIRFLVFLGMLFTSLFAENVSSLLKKKEIWKKKKGPVYFCTVGCYPGKDPHPFMFRLFNSAEKHGIPITHIGKDSNSWGGNITKPIWFYNYIKTLPDEAIVVCTDACDVFFCAPEKEILEKFRKMDAPIVFSTERNCYPYAYLRPHFQGANTSFKYLNAGGFLGYAGALKYMLKEITSQIRPGMTSDQALYSTYYVSHSGLICLDTSCDIFCSLYSVHLSEVGIERSRVYVKETRSYPAIIHGNGDKGKPPFMKLYNALNY